MGDLPRVVSLGLLAAIASACAQEPIFDPSTAAATGSPSSAADSGSGSGGDDDSSSTGDGASGPSGPTTTGGDGGSRGEGGAGSSGGGGEDVVPATFTLSVDGDAPVLELRDSATITVTIDADGDVGTVSLVVEGLPGDVTATVDDTVDVSDGTQTALVELSSASSTVTGTFDFTVRATAAGSEETAAGQVVVEPVITIYIPQNLDGLQENPPNTTAFGAYPTTLTAPPNLSGDNPVTVRFFNQDAVPHQIHAGDQNGFDHSQADIPANGYDPMDRRVTAAGTYDYYPHDCCGQSILGRIVIE